jgi:glycosyltransferase involved in cell wall biosynthesis
MGCILIAGLFALAYFILQVYYLKNWLATPQLEPSVEFTPGLNFTIVVVARNEEATISNCIEGLLNQDYPPDLFEIIVINDRSTDRTLEKIEAFQSSHLKLFHLEHYPEFINIPAYKKSAIELGVSKAQHEWIVVTDADCIHSTTWLRSLANYQQQTDSLFMTAPVQYISTDTIFKKMQAMEIQALMVITAAGIHSGMHDMANGANMAFSKKSFMDVGGYKGNFQYPSGDDMFLIEKIRFAFPEKISFVKSMHAIVKTEPAADWNTLLRQRVRWAGKNKGLKNQRISWIWLLVGFYHILMLLMLLLALVHVCNGIPLFILLATKWIADGLIIYHASIFFKEKPGLKFFIPLQLMYMVYVMALGWSILIHKKSDW